MSRWYEKSGKNGEVIVSTRIRLARNLKDYPFPCKLENDKKREVNDIVTDVLINGNSLLSKKFRIIDLDNLDRVDLVSLVEKHLVSPGFITNNKFGRLLLIDDESVSIMLNEEDHIRIQVMREGLDLEGAYDIADKIDTLLSERLNYAFSDKFGYLTQCPTNLGTGMRASTMMHLPALKMRNSIDSIYSDLSKLGFTLRGSHGEGSKALGNLYQISNQVTLGLSEKDSIDNLKNITLQIVEQELAIRKLISKNITVLDKIGRSLGILLNSRVLDNEEFINLISNVRLGISIGQIKDIDYGTINSLMTNAQPATLMRSVGKETPVSKINEIRSKLVRDKLTINKITDKENKNV